MFKRNCGGGQGVSRGALTTRTRSLVSAACMVIFCSSCGHEDRLPSRTRLPDPEVARRAVECSLGSWQLSPDLATTSSPKSSIVFVDQQRRQGQRLRAYSLLGESESEGCRRFHVKLTLTDPEESKLVAYNVFGEDPIWVYRSEDFDMIMHWECSVPDDPSETTGPPIPADKSVTKSEQHDPGPASVGIPRSERESF